MGEGGGERGSSYILGSYYAGFTAQNAEKMCPDDANESQRPHTEINDPSGYNLSYKIFLLGQANNNSSAQMGNSNLR